MKDWKIYLIHHSHTDIGYTERQEKITRYHADFIRQAIGYLDAIHAGTLAACRGFKWQCENYWQVESFYATATAAERQKFEQYVQSGEIGLSGNYLNLTELVDEKVLRRQMAKMGQYAQTAGVTFQSGMTADIDGYAWGYPDLLKENGVENLFCALHSHHGMFPLYKKQQPFYWRGPKGGTVLTWVGEHYYIGNELGFAPDGMCSYMLHDDVREDLEAGRILRTDAAATQEQELAAAKLRLCRYLEQLEKEEYPFDFVPLMISGVGTDNSAPNPRIAERAAEVSRLLPGITAKMATLDEFFDAVQNSGVTIPVYSGDFTDWWADGVGSTPNTLKLYREAQRKFDLCEKLDPACALGDAAQIDRAAQNMVLYAEHTWGYSSSVSEPWDTLVAALEKKNDAYAINANTAAAENLDEVLAKKGESSIRVGRPQQYRVVNPHPFAFTGTVKLYVEFWEMPGARTYDEQAVNEVYDRDTGERYPSQSRRIARAYEIETAMTLQPGEERNLLLRQCRDNPSTVQNHAYLGSEGVRDILRDAQDHEMPFLIETPCFRVEFSAERGIASIRNQSTGAELLLPNAPGAFTGIYERTPAGSLSQCEIRRRMGRNRCALGTQRAAAKLTDVEIVESGEVCIVAKLSYTLPGCQFYSVFLKIYKTVPMLEARVCLHKDSVWDPENLYVALPFTAGGENETYADKTGCILRPGIDQLPGSNQNFWLLQNGLVRRGVTGDLILACKDAPLMTFGPRGAAPIRLCGGDNRALNADTAYSWVMNNFWETNFKADLGGFYEFTYLLYCAEPASPESQMEHCKALNEGLLGYYV